MKLEKILLVQPQTQVLNADQSLDQSLSNDAAVKLLPFQTFNSTMTPLALVTLAALTPPGIDVAIWDEDLQGPLDQCLPADAGYDLIGITGFSAHLDRAVQIGAFLNTRGIPSVIGGPGVSSEPERCRGHFDYLFLGEAEFTWPQFLEEFRAGTPRDVYRQVEKPDLTDSPVPRWELLPNLAKDYAMALVQTTRGCPFDCEFCDVIYLFGRKPRSKPIPHVLEEIKKLESMGARRILISDDNFIGKPAYAKELLRALIPLNNSFRRPLSFATQLTMNVAKDDELLELLADANFWRVQIGIESENLDSLKETNKPQNYKTDILRDIHKVHSYGITIQGPIILGFDNDDSRVFERTESFIQKLGLPLASLNVLTAPAGTRLWSRMRKEGRLIMPDRWAKNPYIGSNIVFKQMPRTEVFQGYVDVYKRLYSIEAMQERMLGMIDQVKRKPRKPFRFPFMFWEERKRIYSIFSFFLFTEDKPLRNFFVTSLLTTLRKAPFMLERVVMLIIGMLAYKQVVAELEVKYKALIDHEKRNPPPVEPPGIWISIPDAFRKEYKALFPSVFGRLHAGIKDKSRLNDALIEVFSDFLERFHKQYGTLGAERFLFLQETCDRSIASFNHEDPSQARYPDGYPIRLTTSKLDERELLLEDNITPVIRPKLDDEVLKAVEQELNAKRVDPLVMPLAT